MQRYQLNPWKYGGWAMYVTARRNPEIQASLRVADEWRPLPAEGWGPEIFEVAQRFLASRNAHGIHAEPQDLARSLLEWNIDAEQVRILVKDFSLDRETARVDWSAHEYVYAR